MTIERVGVIGGGLMGSGIAEVCARAGSDVIVHEVDAALAEAALGRVQTSLDKALARGKVDESGRESILERIRVSTNLADQADRQLVIEAATENETLKRQIFTDLDGVLTDADAILASNTSSIPITRLEAVTERTGNDRLHFFNPVPVWPWWSWWRPSRPERDQRSARSYAESLGKTVILAKDA
jgi:3-hydroxybutyryl-CoA dehydrogenase